MKNVVVSLCLLTVACVASAPPTASPVHTAGPAGSGHAAGPADPWHPTRPAPGALLEVAPGALHVLSPKDGLIQVSVLAPASLAVMQGCLLLFQRDVVEPGIVEIPGSLGQPGRDTLLLAMQRGVALGDDDQCVKCREQLGSARLPTSPESGPPVASVPGSKIGRPCCPAPPKLPTETFFCK